MRTPAHTLPFLGPEPEYQHANGFMREEPTFDTIRRYWFDQDFADEIDAETAAMRAKAHAAIDACIQRNREKNRGN